MDVDSSSDPSLDFPKFGVILAVVVLCELLHKTTF